jgi:hypothetical protein
MKLPSKLNRCRIAIDTQGEFDSNPRQSFVCLFMQVLMMDIEL